jgi:molybdate transport system substrate-binding protein
MQLRSRCSVWLLLLFLVLAGRGGAAPEVTVLAPASLLEALTEVVADVEARGEFRVRTVFGATNTLARQIRAGARADVFISADELTTAELARAGDLTPESRRVIVSNQLAVVVPRDSAVVCREAADLAGPTLRRLALAETATVPAGRYARAWLEQEGLWDAVAARVVAADSVRAALARVAAGHADAGIVYRSDLTVSSEVRVAWLVPMEDAPRILYPAAVLRRARDPKSADAFVAALLTERAQRRFAARGFGPPSGNTP